MKIIQLTLCYRNIPIYVNIDNIIGFYSTSKDDEEDKTYTVILTGDYKRIAVQNTTEEIFRMLNQVDSVSIGELR